MLVTIERTFYKLRNGMVTVSARLGTACNRSTVSDFGTTLKADAVVSFPLPGLRKYRRAAHMKQYELAQRVGLRPETICRLEKQRQAAGVDSVRAIARELGVSPEHLTSGVDPVLASREARRALRRRGERQCTECGEVKPIAAYVPIKNTLTGVYGRCRACRSRRARERYQSDAAERGAQKAHVRRNRIKLRMFILGAGQVRSQSSFPTAEPI